MRETTPKYPMFSKIILNQLGDVEKNKDYLKIREASKLLSEAGIPHFISAQVSTEDKTFSKFCIFTGNPELDSIEDQKKKSDFIAYFIGGIFSTFGDFIHATMETSLQMLPEHMTDENRTAVFQHFSNLYLESVAPGWRERTPKENE